VWATPKSTHGWEGLFRVDHGEPNTALPTQIRTRTIAGVAYWFPHQGAVATALLLDVDNTRFADFVPVQPTQRKYTLHAMLTF
jgi:hypothetical protein